MQCYFCESPDLKLITCGDCKVQGCADHIGYHNKGGTCQPWRVGTVTGAGRGLFASRDIRYNEVKSNIVQYFPKN